MACYAYSVLTRWFSSVYCGAGSETALSKQSKHDLYPQSRVVYRVVRVREDSFQLPRPNPAVQEQARPLRVTTACIHIYGTRQLAFEPSERRTTADLALGTESVMKGLSDFARSPILPTLPVLCTCQLQLQADSSMGIRIVTATVSCCYYLVAQTITHKKEQGLVSAITLHMPCRLALGNSESHAPD